MIGAIIGDIVGSRFERQPHKSKSFALFTDASRFTDDSVMSLAVAEALRRCDGDWQGLSQVAVQSMQAFGRRYPDCGFGPGFARWLQAESPRAYGSFGNGAAMRVSACGHVASSLAEVKELSTAVTAVSHDHPEALKGAEAIAVAVFLAKKGKEKEEIHELICRDYYELEFTLREIRDEYSFDVSCQGSVPQALQAFFEAHSFEDAVRNAISLGGDSDTLAAMAGSVAEAYYGVPQELREQALSYLDDHLREHLILFETWLEKRESIRET